MTTDPNWLYSTIAQSSAAIVAIIGGFITATILARKAEKASLMKERDNKKAQLRELNSKPLTPLNKLPEQDILHRREKALEEEARNKYLRFEILNLEGRLKAFSYPPHLGWGLVILGCFAFASILMPVMVIAIGVYSDSLAALNLTLFALGLAAVFGYIAFQIRERRRK
jgi:hypothetical protein